VATSRLYPPPPPPGTMLFLRQLVHFLRVVLVDLVLNGHAHRLEYLRTGDTGHADSTLTGSCAVAVVLPPPPTPEGPELTESYGTER